MVYLDFIDRWCVCTMNAPVLSTGEWLLKEPEGGFRKKGEFTYGQKAVPML